MGAFDDEEVLGVVLLVARAAGVEALTLEDLHARGVVLVLRDKLGGHILLTAEEVRRMARALIGEEATEA